VSVRATLGGIFASAAILGIGWQFGSAAAHTFATQASTPPSTTTGSTGTDSPTASAAPAPSSSPPVSASAGSASGTFIGAVESTRYGDVQVEITVANGKITDVTALHLTDRDGRSVQISNRAAPTLRSEVISSQSARVDSVSGATYTSDGYVSSVQSAIDRAGL